MASKVKSGKNEKRTKACGKSPKKADRVSGKPCLSKKNGKALSSCRLDTALKCQRVKLDKPQKTRAKTSHRAAAATGKKKK